ncbi:hypothetical protein KY284_037041 [Solanum tuberosum]|nr:hypothetical protein KY284_037041 [Solanum tuberosum]
MDLPILSLGGVAKDLSSQRLVLPLSIFCALLLTLFCSLLRGSVVILHLQPL